MIGDLFLGLKGSVRRSIPLSGLDIVLAGLFIFFLVVLVPIARGLYPARASSTDTAGGRDAGRRTRHWTGQGGAASGGGSTDTAGRTVVARVGMDSTPDASRVSLLARNQTTSLASGDQGSDAGGRVDASTLRAR